ncbi:MAG: hypothetical protein K2G28_00635 [Acetatifactor sp.]|nr:hypothetical protein [Acetatifactor sp.]MDE7354098.1 hypothetical protein [Acetatifactor sp.]
MSALLLTILAAGLYIINRFDEGLTPDRRTGIVILAGVPAGAYFGWRAAIQSGILPALLLEVVIGCLLLACITDCATCQVYRFVWWISGGAALLLLGVEGWPEGERLWGLALFCFLQLILFSHMYGKGDCHAFCVCAAVEAAAGMDFTGFLIHMLVSFSLLAAVQVARGNVSRKGSLKHPVPFLPYITISFLVVLLFFS